MPKCLALVVCNEIIEDKKTNNKTLVSLFNSISAKVFPFKFPKMVVLASLTNGRSRVEISARISSMEDQTQVLSVKGAVEFPNPLAVCDLVVEFRSVPFKKPGMYAVEILCEDQLLAERRIMLHATPEKHADPPDNP